MRILFVSDIHGSNEVFRKTLSATLKYNIDLLIISGDLSGKDIRPIIKTDKEYIIEYEGKKMALSNDGVLGFEKKLSDLGHYFFRTNEEKFIILNNNPSLIFNILDEKIIERVEQWVLQIIEQIDLSKTTVLISPGNDDIFEIDTLLEQYESQGISSGINHPVKVNNFEIISLDFSNPTPWKTERELSERKLKKMITEKVLKLDNLEKTIFNFHCPPIRSKLDIAPEIDKDFRYVINPGHVNIIHAGSTAIRNAIEKYQPILSLHGHIHESHGFDYIGRTLALNPGSEHDKGILNAYIIDLSQEGDIKNFFLIED